MWKFAVAVGVAGAFVSGVTPARAVIVIGDQGRNTSAPTGALAGSGWDLQGSYGDFLGTPIAPNWFITANHFGAVDTALTTPDGVAHPVTNTVNIAGTDLVLRQVSVPFASYAAIYNPATDGALSTSDSLVVFGRGTARGDAIPGHGWAWGADDHVKSYGTNTVKGIATVEQADIDAGSPFALNTAFLVADFSNAGDPNEGTLSNGDSGGGVFIFKNGGWKLAGINYGVDLYSNTPTGPDALAAVYDARGLYADQGAGVYTYVDPDPAVSATAVAQNWYASYVPASLGIITATVPEPASAGVLMSVAIMSLSRRRSR